MADLEGFFRMAHGAGGALLADAGYQRDPITAQGMSDAFRRQSGSPQRFARPSMAGSGLRPRSPIFKRFAIRHCCRCTTLRMILRASSRLLTRLAALSDHPAETRSFLGVIAGTVPVQEFFGSHDSLHERPGAVPAAGPWGMGKTAVNIPPMLGWSLVVLALTAVAPRCVGQEPGREIAFAHANVIPMREETVLREQTVVVRDGKIATIQADASARPRAGAVIIDARGMYLIPGLVDSHIHLESAAILKWAFGKDISVDYSKTLFPYIYNGVTTVLLMAGEPTLLALRDQIAHGEIAGPRLFVSALVDGAPPQAIGPQVNVAATAEDAAALAKRLHAQGYDQLKVYSALTPQVFDALVAAAQTLHWPVAGHIPQEIGVEHALSGGLQMVAHGEEFMNFSSTLSDTDIEHFTALAVKYHTWLTPTLTNYHNIVEQIADLHAVLAKPEYAYVNPYIRLYYLPRNSKYKDFIGDPAILASMRNRYAFIGKLVHRFSEASVPLLAGTDSLNPAVIGGFSLHDELEELVQCGLSPYQALYAATAAPAQYLDQSARWGTIEVGAAADLVLLKANPLERISNTRLIQGVMVKGIWYSRHVLDHRAARLKANYQRAIERTPMLRPLRQQVTKPPVHDECQKVGGCRPQGGQAGSCEPN